MNASIGGRRGTACRARPLLLVVLARFSAAFPLIAEDPPSLAEHPAVAGALELLELWTEEQRAYQDLPGLSMAVVHDQELVWARGFGLADRGKEIPATADTLYRLGSVTKLFTATAVLQLRDRGKLRLDDPVAEHLPWFRVQTDFETWGPITVRHLLTHTSGLPREAAFPYWTTHEFPCLEEIAGALPEQQAVYPPGSRYKYSNLGLALLGAIVEAVSGESYAETLEENLFRPLGMDDTTVAPTAEHHRRRAVSYLRKLEDEPRQVFDYYDTGGLAPAANAVSSVRDLARFAAFQFREDSPSGKAALRRSTVLEMHRPHWVHESWNGGRGLGFSISRRDGETVVSHGGWIGGNRSHFLLVPERKVAVIAITNADDGNPVLFTTRAYDLLAPALERARKAAEAAEPSQEVPWQQHAQAYVGTYTDPWHWRYRVMVLDGKLTMYGHDYPPSDDPAGGLDVLEPVREHTFRLGDGELVVFELNDDGRVERIRRRYEILLPVAGEDQ